MRESEVAQSCPTLRDECNCAVVWAFFGMAAYWNLTNHIGEWIKFLQEAWCVQCTCLCRVRGKDLSWAASSFPGPGVPFADSPSLSDPAELHRLHVASVSQNQWMERESGRISGAGSTVLGQFMRFTQRKLCWKVCWSLYRQVADLGQGRGVHDQAPPDVVREGQGLGQTIPSLCPSRLSLCWVVSVQKHPHRPIYFQHFNITPATLTKDFSWINLYR